MKIPVVVPSSPINFWGKSVNGVYNFWSDKQTNKQIYLFKNKDGEIDDILLSW